MKPLFQPLFCTLLALGCMLLGACSRSSAQFEGKLQRQEAWSPELTAQMASLPVQDNGRVKPLASFASFLLYKVHGRRDMKFQIGEEKFKLEPTEWLLDVWCYPDQAVDYPLFRIENTGVLDTLGIENAGQTLDFEYVSYRRILDVSDTLGALAQDYDGIDSSKRNAVQEHIVQLWRQLKLYHRVHQQLGGLHHDFRLEGDELRAVFGGVEEVRLAAFATHAEGFRDLVKSVGRDFESERLGNAMDLLSILEQMRLQPDAVGLLPPKSNGGGQDANGGALDSGIWSGLSWSIDHAIRGTLDEASKTMLVALQGAILASGKTDDAVSRDRSLLEYRSAVVTAAKSRGEFESIETESQYYRDSWHYKALHWFIFGFLLAAVSWLLPRSRLVWWASFAVTTIALGILVYDIYLRCVITGRPPIKNLYDTFLFIAASGVLISLVVEVIFRHRIALALAPIFGGLLVMLARMYELMDGKDTMDPLVAVLDSNYWLATHVTMINFGYGAAMVAGALLANAWIVVRVLRIAHPSDVVCKLLVRAVYGVTCFSLLFTVVGTIYGGVWANDSWGRFWGWDPKENGALMICLSQIAMLHARFSGLIRDFGTVIWALVTWMIVVFSWMHTNLLGVGLHNYGFSSGLRDAVWSNYTIEVGIIVVGTVDYLLRPNPARRGVTEPAQSATE